MAEKSADYQAGWDDATRAASRAVQTAVDEWFSKGLVAEAAGLTQLRDFIVQQRPE